MFFDSIFRFGPSRVTEVVGIEGDKVILQDLFRYSEEAGLTSTGIRPVFLPKLESAGFQIANETFMTAGPAARLRR